GPCTNQPAKPYLSRDPPADAREDERLVVLAEPEHPHLHALGGAPAEAGPFELPDRREQVDLDDQHLYQPQRPTVIVVTACAGKNEQRGRRERESACFRCQ